MNKEKFETKFSININGCWDWIEHKDKDGYGKVRVGKDKLRAHRVSYELYVGEIPSGLVIDHLCLNKSCVNPEHLEPVTLAENNKRRPYTKLCEHNIGITKCDICSIEYLNTYRRNYYHKNKSKIQSDSRKRYKNITEEQRERRNALARKRYRDGKVVGK